MLKIAFFIFNHSQLAQNYIFNSSNYKIESIKQTKLINLKLCQIKNKHVYYNPKGGKEC